MSNAMQAEVHAPDERRDVAMRQETAPVAQTESAAVLSIIDRAARDPNVDIDKLERLMRMRQEMADKAARRAFNEAVAEAKTEIAPVVRNKAGHNNKRYADFGAIALAVDPVISRHGLSYRFRTAQTDRISVTCVLSHNEGHSEETTLSGPPDASGSKNAIQAIGSTLTYLQRYSLVQALGLAATDDDDGQTAGASGSITDEQAGEIRALMEEVGADVRRFCEYLKVPSIADIPASRFKDAVAALNAKRSPK